ncbi:MAG: beta-ketoacyl synthase chain length factor [Mariprofundaceae bacterium]
MDNASLAVLGTGVSFQNPEHAQTFGYKGCDMQATLLPANLRRRTSTATKMAFAAAERACRSAGVIPSELPVIFTSTLGEISVTDKLCYSIAHQRFPVSPTQFHNSVHNTASGYWSIAVGNKHSAMAMGAYQDGFALALLEAWSQLHTLEDKLLLVCYEETPPELLLPNNHWVGCAVAFVLTSGQLEHGDVVRMSMPRCDHEKCSKQRFEDVSPVFAAMPLLHAIEHRTLGTVQVSAIGDGTWFTELFCTRL